MEQVEAVEAEEAEEAPASRRGGRRDRSRGRSGKKGRGKKKFDVMPVIMVIILVGAVGGGLAYFPLQKRTLRSAVAAGGRTGFDAARELAKTPDEASTLYGIVETSKSGRMAAAGALALIVRRTNSSQIVGEIQRRLKKGVSAEAQAAYAAALAQSRTEAGETAAAVIVANGSAEAKRAAVRGLANGRTAAAAEAVGKAMGDPDSGVRLLAEAAVSDWVATAPEKAARAAAAALAVDDEAVQVAAAKIMFAAARGVGPEQLLPLLLNNSEQVRELGLKAAMASGALQQADEALIAAVVKLVDVDDQPPGVKTAALDAATAGDMKDASPGALAILERDPDTEVRVRAAHTVGALRPEGMWDALVAPLLEDNAPRELSIACLSALTQKDYPAPPEKLELVTEALLGKADGADETLAGLALMALGGVTGKRKVMYNAAQWRTFIARMAFETRIYGEARELFKMKKKEYEEVKDDPEAVEAIAKTIQDAGWYLQTRVIPDAIHVDRDKLGDLRDAMRVFLRKLTGK